MTELVGLRAVNEELQRRGGRVLAVSVDPPSRSREVVQNRKLGFSILADESGDTLRKYGLLHEGGGPGKKDVALPAHVLVARDRQILWKRQSARVQDRPNPEDLEALVRGLRLGDDSSE